MKQLQTVYGHEYSVLTRFVLYFGIVLDRPLVRRKAPKKTELLAYIP